MWRFRPTPAPCRRHSPSSTTPPPAHKPAASVTPAPRNHRASPPSSTSVTGPSARSATSSCTSPVRAPAAATTSPSPALTRTASPSRRTPLCSPQAAFYTYGNQQQCSLNLYYTPSALGVGTAYVNIAGVGRFTLTGTGDPAGADFDFFQYFGNNPGYAAPLNTLNLASSPLGTPAYAYFAIKDTGAVSPLALNPPLISGPNAADFAVTGVSCLYISCPTVTFAPTGLGTRSATLTYTDSTNTVTRAIEVVS